MCRHRDLRRRWFGGLLRADARYQEVVFEQCELCVEMADRVSARRSLANTFFLSLNSAVVAVVVAAWEGEGSSGRGGGTADTVLAACATGIPVDVVQCLFVGLRGVAGGPVTVGRGAVPRAAPRRDASRG
ncbi:RipA family octameric membrane protein [Streptomyces spiralis]|uniref:RipA family octameric membrane protein n=1 Tax=Streptomyces spiralis TaxID=66376 RepID=UPI003402937B